MTLPSNVYFNATTGFTISLWIKYVTAKNYQGIIDIISDNNALPTSRVTIYFDLLTTFLKLQLISAGTSYVIMTTRSISLNEWFHIAVTYNGEVIYFYINGKVVAKGTSKSPTFAGMYSEIGNSHNNGALQNSFNGYMDQLKIFKKALNQREIVYEMNFNDLVYRNNLNYMPILKEELSKSSLLPITTKGLVYYWPIAGSTIDVVSGKDMTLVTNAALTTDRFGNPNSALKFTLGYATVPSDVYFDGPSCGFTVMVWLYLLGWSNAQRIIDFGNGNDADNIMFMFGSGQLYFNTFSFTTAYNLPQITVNLNQWMHIAATFNSGTISVYINGILATSLQSAAFRSEILRTSNYVGKSNWPGDGLANSILDELKIFNKPLSVEEIKNEKDKLQPYKIIKSQLIKVYSKGTSLDALINYWPLTGTFVDLGLGIIARDLILGTSAVFTQDRFGVENAALGLKSGYMIIPPGIPFNPSTGLTVMLWIKYNVMIRPGQKIIEIYSNSTISQQFFIYFNSLTFNTQFWNPSANIVCTSSKSINLNEWTHIATTFNGGTIKNYINGVEDGSVTTANNVFIAFTSFNSKIGSTISNTDFIDATIDEVKFFNRGLSVNEINSEQLKIEPFKRKYL